MYNATTDLLDRHLAEGRGARIAYRHAQGTTSYAELAERVNAAGQALSGLGLEPEQRVLLLLQDTIDFPAVFLGAHPAVLEAAVVGAPDADTLIKPKAFVVLKPGQTASENELQAFVKERLAPYKYPRWVEIVAELPKTATGKIQRFQLRTTA
jgi:acyl-coenzyme A synthetase/AMP-(fatty) acid ligase